MYENLKKYMESKGLKEKEKVVKEKVKGFKNLKAQDKWDLIEQLLRDLNYIE